MCERLFGFRSGSPLNSVALANGSRNMTQKGEGRKTGKSGCILGSCLASDLFCQVQGLAMLTASESIPRHTHVTVDWTISAKTLQVNRSVER